jgi:hypothetical protein
LGTRFSSLGEACISSLRGGIFKVFKLFFGPGNRKPFFVQEMLDVEQQLNITTAIQTVTGWGFAGFDTRKLSLPVTQDVRFDPNNLRHFSNPEIQLVG